MSDSIENGEAKWFFGPPDEADLKQLIAAGKVAVSLSMPELIEKVQEALDGCFDRGGAVIIDQPVLQQLLDELTRLRNQAATQHTQVACTKCGRGVRNQYSVLGMHPTCAEAELTRLRGIEAAWLDGRTPRAVRVYLDQYCHDVPLHVETWLHSIANALEADA